MLNHHPEIHIKNEGWLFNDRGGSFDAWFDRAAFDRWAVGREARGTWLSQMLPDEAARLMQRAMLRELFYEGARREPRKNFAEMRWVGDKTTMFYTQNIDALHTLFPEARFLSIIRDGRDSAVSNLHLTFREECFHALPPDCSEFAQRSFEFHVHGRGEPVPLFSRELLIHYTAEWIESVYGARRAAALYGPLFHELTYETLVADPQAEYLRVLQWLDVSTDPAMLRSIVEDHTFERLSDGRKPGHEDPLAERRKGIIGDWRSRFTDEDKQTFKGMAGSLLIELGYEQDFNW